MRTPTPESQPAPTELLGGRYRVVGPIGEGGMGQVVEAQDQLLQRRVAIKLLPPALEAVMAEQPIEHFLSGMPEGNWFAALALAGRADDARTFASVVEALLPVAGQPNVHGAYVALEGFVLGLALLGDRDRCGLLYPLALEDVGTGLVLQTTGVGPTNAQLTAAIVAAAAGLPDKADEHFETAAEQARDYPSRLLEPAVMHWYGRALIERGGTEVSGGRGMVETALETFKTLGMVPYVRLAEQRLGGAS